MSEEIEDIITDEHGNTASILYWGSREAAQAALDSCRDCSYCRDCRDCSDCSGCRGCRDCSDCSYCRDCSGCSGCSGCRGCSDCRDCSYCSDCSDCRDCSDCSDCSGCRGCRDCSDCSGCRGCSGCSEHKIQSAIPALANIHATVLEACERPDALNMATWHTCETTHCRAGWVVVLAGDDGKKLEAETSTVFAAMQIYKKSGYEISPNRFYDSDEKALDDMRRLAKEEAGVSEA